MSGVSLVIPCHNEQDRLSEQKTLQALKELGDGAEILLVDDGSTDSTARVIKKIASLSPSIQTLILERNGGKAEAVRAGMLNCLERGAEIVGFCDADFATPPEEVARVFAGLEKNTDAGAAIGSRNLPQSENISRTGARRFLSGVFSVIASFALKKRVSDSQCGAKFFRKTPALTKALEEPFLSRWGFDVEIIGRIETEKDASGVVEVPLKSWSEKAGSRLSPLSMLATLVEMYEINGDLKERRGKANNRRGFLLEALFTVFVRMAPLYILTFILAKILFWEEYWVNPDAYYHLGVGIAYMENGWLWDFPWLKYTVLGENFPNVYFLQHLLLGITNSLIPSQDPIIALKTTIMTMAFLQILSFYLFLRKWKVSGAVMWTIIGITVSSNMIWHTIALKGITLFSIMLPWIVDALWSNSNRRAFFVGWLASYVYVGFIIMVPLAACRVLGQLIFDGKLKIKIPLLLFAGVALGMVLSPFFPNHLFHIVREIKTVFERPDFVKPGDFFGSEWQSLHRLQLQHFLGGFLLPAIAATAFYMRRKSGPGGIIGSAFLAVFIFALLPFKGGAKFAQIFVVVSATMVPLIYEPILRAGVKIRGTGIKIKPFLPIVFVLIFLVYSLPFIKGRQRKEAPKAPVPSSYSKMAEMVKTLTDKNKVVIAPWDDFPGLFFFNKNNYYVSGMNNLFLYHNDPQRFTAYYKLFKGGIQNPAKTVPLLFDGADLILVRDTPRTDGEVKMNKILENAQGLKRITEPDGNGLVAGYWRVYKIIGEPVNAIR
ncbi:glycosyltransferase [Candidatus Mycalebacterium sp.]